MKKLLSLFLALVMMATMIPAAAAAGFATLNISTYTSDTVLRFTSISGTSLGSSANNLANAGFKLGMACWDLLLATNLNMDMSDIGFSNY